LTINFSGPPWHLHTYPAASCYGAGQFDKLDNLVRQVSGVNLTKIVIEKRMIEWLEDQNSCFGLIIETSNFIIAASDQIRSYPIFVHEKKEGAISVGTSFPSINEVPHPLSQNHEATEEFLLCGYALGKKTIFREISILPAGNLLVYNKQDGAVVTKSYFQYVPDLSGEASEALLLTQFGTILDKIFGEIVRNSLGRPIWIPLSGGLDSRLILAKLVEHGHSNLTAFSFGLRGNHEIRRARKVANKLGVKWLNLPSRVHQLTKLYSSTDRRRYSNLCFSGQSSPIWLDFEAIYILKTRAMIPNDALIINGFSGDFLFGGHIPDELVKSPRLETLSDYIIAKHCSHFTSDHFERCTTAIRDQLLGEYEEIFGLRADVNSLCSFYEYWDWKERQVKAVVSGQRLYDAFHLDWRLPFWNKELMDFWRTIPLSFKLSQSLHLTYLQKYNFRGVFDKLRSTNQLWTPGWRWVPVVGFITNILFGSQHKVRFYERLYYYGFHRFQLGLFGKRLFLSTYRYLRRPYVVPLSAFTCLKENDLWAPPEDVLFSCKEPQIED
jgi:asparagine synthase (glutamine-hydrolysing)